MPLSGAQLPGSTVSVVCAYAGTTNDKASRAAAKSIAARTCKPAKRVPVSMGILPFTARVVLWRYRSLDGFWDEQESRETTLPENLTARAAIIRRKVRCLRAEPVAWNPILSSSGEGTGRCGAGSYEGGMRLWKRNRLSLFGRETTFNLLQDSHAVNPFSATVSRLSAFFRFAKFRALMQL